MFASLSVAVTFVVFGLPLGLASHHSNVIVFSVVIAAAAVSGGADVMTAGSAGEALHLLARHRFDVLVADLGMPEQDGLALIRVIREQAASAYRSIPAIAVTAYAAIRERDEALEAGFQFHLSKPVDPDQLALAVSTAIARAGRRERA